MWIWMLTASAAPLTLQDALDDAVERPSVEAARLDARAVRFDASAAWLGATGPIVGASLTTDSRTRELAIETPIGPFVQQPKDVVSAGARVSVPLLKPSALFAEAPAASALARASVHGVDRASDLARLEAAGAWSRLVEVEARLTALADLELSLQEVRTRSRALQEQGLAVGADLLRVDVALADVRVARARLEAVRETARFDLGRTTGRDTAIDADPVWVRPPDPEPLAEVRDLALANRPDLRGLEDQLQAATLARAIPALSALPTVGVYGQATWTNNSTLVDGAWVQAGIEVAWTPIAAGTRVPQLLAAGDRLEAVRARLIEARRGVEAELAAARADLVAALAEVDAREVAVSQSREASRLIRARYAEGLAPLVDVLDATAKAADQQAGLATARARAQQARVVWDVARGQGQG
jgi:outer membrane protein TolC